MCIEENLNYSEYCRLVEDREKENLISLAKDWEKLTQVYIARYMRSYASLDSLGKISEVSTIILRMARSVRSMSDDFLVVHADLQGWTLLMSSIQLIETDSDEVELYLTYSQCADLALHIGAWARGYCEARGWLPKYLSNPYAVTEPSIFNPTCKAMESMLIKPQIKDSDDEDWDDPLYMPGCQESSGYF